MVHSRYNTYNVYISQNYNESYSRDSSTLSDMVFLFPLDSFVRFLPHRLVAWKEGRGDGGGERGASRGGREERKEDSVKNRNHQFDRQSVGGGKKETRRQIKLARVKGMQALLKKPAL